MKGRWARGLALPGGGGVGLKIQVFEANCVPFDLTANPEPTTDQCGLCPHDASIALKVYLQTVVNAIYGWEK